MESETNTKGSHPATRSSLTGLGLDAIVTILSVLMMTGVALDFRAHSEGISFAEEGFLTLEHVFFYAMFLGIAAIISTATYRERRRGQSWIDAVPNGYGWSVVGVLLFGLGGVGDYGWHSTFGFEQGIEALTSPTHILLATGAALFLSSPLRAAWRREINYADLEALPAVVSGSLTVTVFALFSLYANPIGWYFVWTEGQTAHQLGVVGFIVFPAILVGAALTIARGFDLPTGSFTILLTVPALASAAVGHHLLLVGPAVLAGFVADAIARYASPTPKNPRIVRVFSALVPLVFAGSYFAFASVIEPIAWTVHVWTGTVVIAGLTGLLVSYVSIPDATGGA